MSEQQREEFRKLLRDMESTHYIASGSFVYDAMKAAHNAAVRRDADAIESQRLVASSASSPAAQYVREWNIDLDRTKELLLKNLIP